MKNIIHHFTSEAISTKVVKNESYQLPFASSIPKNTISCHRKLPKATYADVAAKVELIGPNLMFE
jgi:hypothetical protein